MGEILTIDVGRDVENEQAANLHMMSEPRSHLELS